MNAPGRLASVATLVLWSGRAHQRSPERISAAVALAVVTLLRDPNSAHRAVCAGRKALGVKS